MYLSCRSVENPACGPDEQRVKSPPEDHPWHLTVLSELIRELYLDEMSLITSIFLCVGIVRQVYGLVYGSIHPTACSLPKEFVTDGKGSYRPPSSTIPGKQYFANTKITRWLVDYIIFLRLHVSLLQVHAP